MKNFSYRRMLALCLSAAMVAGSCPVSAVMAEGFTEEAFTDETFSDDDFGAGGTELIQPEDAFVSDFASGFEGATEEFADQEETEETISVPYEAEEGSQDGTSFETAFDLGDADEVTKTFTLQPSETVYFKNTLAAKAKYDFTVTGGSAYLSRYRSANENDSTAWNGQNGNTRTAVEKYGRTWYYSMMSEETAETELTLVIKRRSLYVDSTVYSTSMASGILGKAVSMTTEATSTLGADKLQYQWQSSADGDEWQDIAGAVNATYTIETVTDDSAGCYRCVVTDGQYTDTKSFELSVSAGLTVLWPGKKDVWVGDTVTLDPSASSASEMTYTWYKAETEGDWQVIPDATESTYTFTMNEDSVLYYRCAVEDKYDRTGVTFYLELHDASEMKAVELELPPDLKEWYIYEHTGNSTEYLGYNKKFKVTYSDGTEEYITYCPETSIVTEDENGDWKEGWHKTVFSYMGSVAEFPFYVARVGSKVSTLTLGTAKTGQSAENIASGYGYYNFTPEKSGMYELSLTGINGSATVEIYEEDSWDPLKNQTVSSDGKLNCSLEAGVNYFAVVKSSSDTSFTYSITFDELHNDMVLGQEYALVKGEETTFTFIPSVDGFYHMDENMGCTAEIYDEDMNLIDRFDTVNDNDSSYLRAGKKYFFIIEAHFDGSKCSLSLTEQASFGEDIVLANKDDKISFTLDQNGVLTYSGTGGLYNNYEYHIIDKKVIKKIVIGEGITNVGSTYSYKFANCTGLTEVTIPSTVTTIPPRAFADCVNLVTVNLPEDNSLEEIGADAFYNTAFYSNQSGDFIMIGNIVLDYVGTDEAVVIPEKAKLLASGAMQDKDTLKQVTILQNLKKIDEFGMAECDNLPEINVPGNVTDIEYCAFYSDTALENAVLNEGVKSIGQEAFFACENLKTITIPKSVTYIGQHAIGYSHAVIDYDNYSVTFNKNEEGPIIKCYFNTSGYWYAKNGEFSYELLDEKDLSNTEITGVYTSSSGTASRPSVTVIFADKTLVQDTDYTVSYAENGDKISITISGKGEYFGSQTLEVPKASTPATPTPAPSNPGTTNPGTITPTPVPATPTPTPVVVKKGTKFTSGNYKYQVTGTNTVAFVGLKKAKTSKVSIGTTVKYQGITFNITSVGKKALYKNAYVTQITVGNKVTSIGDYAFASCKKLKKVTLGTAVKTIGKYAMKSSTKLSYVTIKSTKLKTVKSGAFKSIYSKATIKVPSKKLSAYKKLLKNKGLSSKAKIKK